MALLSLKEVSLEFGDRVILRDAALTVNNGERIGLLGRNGSGKTSLLRIITGALVPDSGEVERRPDLRISELAQALPAEHALSCREYVRGGLANLQALVDKYQRRAARHPSGRELLELERLQQQIDAADGWRLDQRVAVALTDLELPPDTLLGELSGGWRRRAALARALVSDPELLLLDEPTNHLDLSTITWLEQRVLAWSGSILFVTHDRSFLERVATRIIDLDRGRLRSWPGSYGNFLRRRAAEDAAECRADAVFDKHLASEEAWVRQGVKARRRRNQGRVRALEAMREQAAARLEKQQAVRVSIEEGERSGRKVIQLRNVSCGYGDRLLIDHLDLRIMRGDRIGLIGNNGVGKSTLLRLLLGEIKPRTGTIKHGTGLQVGYFNPLRGELDEDRSIAENVGEGRDYILINGKQRHVIGYLRGFLFSARRAMTPVRALSGGERNRVLLARLFARPSNLLVLDEPTNDLDVETLEELERRLAGYQGSLVVASHDRRFLDNTVSSILAFETDGRLRRYAGNFSDWQRQGQGLAELDRPSQLAAEKPRTGRQADTPRPSKLSYGQQRELDELPQTIEMLERSTAALQAEINEADFYTRPRDHIDSKLEALRSTGAALEAAVERWAELEQLRERYESAKRDPNRSD